MTLSDFLNFEEEEIAPPPSPEAGDIIKELIEHHLGVQAVLEDDNDVQEPPRHILSQKEALAAAQGLMDYLEEQEGLLTDGLKMLGEAPDSCLGHWEGPEQPERVAGLSLTYTSMQ